MEGFECETLAEVCPDGDDGDDGDDDDVIPGTDGARRVFKGSLEHALRIPTVEHAWSILDCVLGGLYITSNAVECHFGIKQALRYHRTVKNGDALIRLLFYLKTRLRKLSRAEVKGFLRDEVVTFERIRRVAVGTRIGHRDRSWKRKERAKPVELEACREARPVVIRCRDGRGKRTSRMIEPLEIGRDMYTGMLRVRTYCYLRSAERTFFLDRIADAIPMNIDLLIVA